MASVTPAKLKEENATPAATESPEKAPGSADGQGEEETTDATTTKVRKRRLDVNPNLIISDGRSKRRKSPTPEHTTTGAKADEVEEGIHDPKDPARAQQLGYMIYGKIMAAKASDGESLSEPFVELPNKKMFPDYYETIKVPMSLNMVKAKLDSKGYDNLRGVERDLGQIFNNAKRYNVKESAIFQYAKKLHKMVRTFYAEHTQPGRSVAPDSDDEDHKPPARQTQPPSSSVPPVSAPMQAESSHDGDDDARAGSIDPESGGHRGRKRGSYMKEGPTVYKLVKPILKVIKEAKAKDGSGREIAGIFLELPDRKLFADYYKTIHHPISLKEIEERMIARSYNTWQEFFDDVTLMVRNAQTYNEDDSEVFRDAAQIQEILESHRPAIQERLARAPTDKFRVKPAVATPGRPMESPLYPPRPHPTQTPSPAPYSQAPMSAATPSGMPSYPGIPPSASRESGPISRPSTSHDGGFLPALPKGVVTAEIVASLDRYPQYEQAAWASSLPPVGVQVYRQYLAANEAKKRGPVAPSTPSPYPHAVQAPPSIQMPAALPTSTLADLPSTARTNGATNLPDRLAPPLPVIKYLDFAFSTAGAADRSSAIRLHNMRGVVTHAVVLGSETSELELTAYIADPPKSPTGSSDPTSAVEALESIPEVSLRVNGNVGSLPKFIHHPVSAEAGGAGARLDGTAELVPGSGKRPSGMRWTISVPPARAETKIEVVATKPGALAETSAIFVTPGARKRANRLVVVRMEAD